MQGEPFANRERKQQSQNFIDVLIRFFGFGHTGGVVGFFAWIIASIIQIFSIGAKILTRRKLGIRTVGRVKFFAHLILAFGYVWSFPYQSEEVTTDVDTSISGWIYLLIYLILISILWTNNYLDFKNRKGGEGYSYFRGYGFFTSNSDPYSKKDEWLRLIDPFILTLIIWIGVLIFEFNLSTIAVFLSISSGILFIEECLYIYDEYNFDLDKQDSNILADRSSDENESINSRY